MSRAYEMHVTIEDVTKDVEHAVIDACNEQWNFDDWASGVGGEESYNVEGWGRSRLCGGESEEEFTDRLSFAIWEATGCYLLVRVNATYLEDIPCEVHTRDKDDYNKWKKTK